MIKKYTVEVTMVDGKEVLTRRNEGFNMFELLGLASMIKQEIFEQSKGMLSPDVIKREFVEDDVPPEDEG
jgi:hypothetical protein